MYQTSREWRCAGFLMLGGMLLSGVSASGGDEPPLSNQLSDLGRQAQKQGANAEARTFFAKALALDPANELASRGLKELERTDRGLVRVAMQDPPPPAPGAAPVTTPPPVPAAPEPRATIEDTEAAENIARQQLTNDVEGRIQTARTLLNQGQPEAALSALRLTQNVVRSATNVGEADRAKLDRRIMAQMMATVQAEERIVAERAEHTRLESAAEQRTRTIELFERDKQTIQAMMIQFDTLMRQGVINLLYTGGMGNIAVASAPFSEARLLAQQAYSLNRGAPLPYSDNDPAAGAGKFVSYAMSFYAQSVAFRDLTRFRYLLTIQDVQRAAVPFPDNLAIEYPDAEWWRSISEKRIARWGKAVDNHEQDGRTKQILETLEKPISMPFNEDTPLEEVLKYVKQSTATATFSGIPIYVDPIGLQEAEKSMTSTVRNMELEGVPLKITLKLLLKQLDLTYTVKDGFLMITSNESEDQQTELRVYPVADLAIIPLSLMGGGGMGGGMGGGGMGGGMGGMGGGGMGGMGGGGMGGMGGMMSVPPVDPQDPTGGVDAFTQKKSN